MYVQITSKCNMSCEHCGLRCTMDGEHMAMDTFNQTIKFMIKSKGEEHITIGGGEPTLHPNFWEIVCLSLGNFDSMWMATNGSQTEIALNLARMAKRGVLGCALSLDPWHDEIDSKVVEAFEREHIYNSDNKVNDNREIRNVSSDMETMAPFRNPLDGGSDENCICPDIFIRPNGDIHFCGCQDSKKIGDVFHGIDNKFDVFDFMNLASEYGCWKKYLEHKEDGVSYILNGKNILNRKNFAH